MMNKLLEYKLDLICKEWNLDKDFLCSVNDFDISFIVNELTPPKTPYYYLQRLENIGFVGLDHVLDAGCGIGQWSLGLAKKNTLVTSIDPLKSRLDCAKKIAEVNGIRNINYVQGYVEKINLEDNSLDAIFCYGVIMFTNVEQTLKEFYRILKNGGKLYFNFNALGWYLHLIIDRGLQKKEINLTKNAIKMILNYFLKKDSQKLIRRKEIEKTLLSLGFKNLCFGAEGELAPFLGYNQIKHSKNYPQNYYGYPAVVEVIALK